MAESINNAPTQQSMAFHMLVDEVRQVRKGQEQHQAENREEFRRVREKIDSLRDAHEGRIGAHGEEIARLKTQAESAGRASGRVYGAVSGGLVYGCLKFFEWLLSKF